MAVKITKSDDLHSVTTISEWRQICVAIDALLTKFNGREWTLDIDKGTRAILFAMQVVSVSHRCEQCHQIVYPYGYAGDHEWLYYCDCGEAFSSWETTDHANRIGKF